MPTYGGLRFQDVAKDGVKFGDEDDDEKKEEEDLKSTFAPLVGYLKKELAEFVDKGASACSPDGTTADSCSGQSRFQPG